jgi:N-methylhydantoinase B
VVIGGDAVDLAATEALRNEMRKDRPPAEMFNRGGTIEELRARCKAETHLDPPVSPTFRSKAQ